MILDKHGFLDELRGQRDRLRELAARAGAADPPTADELYAEADLLEERIREAAEEFDIPYDDEEEE